LIIVLTNMLAEQKAELEKLKPGNCALTRRSRKTARENWNRR